jgi:hypothetical protein
MGEYLISEALIRLWELKINSQRPEEMVKLQKDIVKEIRTLDLIEALQGGTDEKLRKKINAMQVDLSRLYFKWISKNIEERKNG